MSRKKVCLSLLIIAFILAATMVMFIEFENFGTAQGQVNITSLTPEQKAAICNPSNPKLKFVNTTESKICGIPVTIKPSANASAAANSTSGAEALSVSPPLPASGS